MTDGSRVVLGQELLSWVRDSNVIPNPVSQDLALPSPMVKATRDPSAVSISLLLGDTDIGK